jgi:imidazolonepropionase-like amidohydrolase
VAKRYLDMGWTSAIGAAAAKPRLDVVLRNAIEAGEFPGPRYLAGSQEITTIGALGDNTLPHMQFEELSFGSVCSGPEEIRKSARTFIKYGVDHLKINLSGEYIAGIAAEQSPFAEDEIAMLASEANRYGKRMAAHARSCESVKQCVRHGIEMVYHASFADDEALDMLEANKDTSTSSPRASAGWCGRTSMRRSTASRRPSPRRWATSASWRSLPNRCARCTSAASEFCQVATTALRGCHMAPTRTTCNTSSTTSA